MKRAIWPMLALAGSVAAGSGPASAESIMQQCGEQYQAAKAANTLNGMTWSRYRTDCSARLKATPASVQSDAALPANPLKPEPAPATAAPASGTAAEAPAPASPEAAPASGKAMSSGRTAFVARERQCGSEWRANKVTLIAKTPGLTWPKYLSQCNTRLKAGQ